MSYILLGTTAHAGIKECTANGLGDHASVRFTIDWEPEGTVLKFAQQIAWEAESLEFKVLYSGEVGGKHLVVASSPARRQTQLVEIQFDASGDHMTRGTMRAGDQVSSMKRMGKSQSYTVECN